ncbi:MAG TPA: aminotransferase class V-fold PLP-dependent enzyme [Candidatus Absconditabacterales bacterium]|nr:aminotransferase class V-fold PLP-dependent enzyme [Candidatus Absconditabacterales bacterium]HNG96657.1 aminotransferase class V-fold PLP-dependent enzyme [Candidatus Absconditabacterales bacterium]
MSYTIRSDFPIFSSHPELIYLDSSATTQKPQYVIQGVSDYIKSDYATIGRGSCTLSDKSDELYFKTKHLAGTLINAKYYEIFFGHNATHCINTIALSLKASGIFKSGQEIILSIAEHHANILIWQSIAKECGVIIKRVGLDDQLQINMLELKKLVNKQTIGVCLTLCSNVLGIKNNLSAVRSIVGPDCFILLDGSQAVPHYKVDVQELDCDFLVWSAHKMLGFTGLGVGYIHSRHIKTMIPGLVGGGVVESGNKAGFKFKTSIEKFEPGTPNIISIVSYYHALNYRMSIGGYTWWESYEQELGEYMITRCQTLPSDRTPIISESNMIMSDRIGLLSFRYENDKTSMTEMSDKLSQNKVCIRSGGHCARPLAHHLGLKNGSIRISSYIYTTKQDIDRFINIVHNI